jgi:hypothetical protein
MVNGLGSQAINYPAEWCELFVARGLFAIRFDNRDLGLSAEFDHFTPDLGAAMQALRDGTEPDAPDRLCPTWPPTRWRSRTTWGSAGLM